MFAAAFRQLRAEIRPAPARLCIGRPTSLPEISGVFPKLRCSRYFKCLQHQHQQLFFGISLAQNCGLNRNNMVALKKPRSSFFVVFGIFERFTERSIKAVMFSQREAMALGNDMVYTQHLLLGLVAEDHASDGFLGSGITIDAARAAVQSLWQDDNQSNGDGESLQKPESSATDVPFSSSTNRMFEAAVEYSKTMGYKFIASEYIAIISNSYTHSSQ